MLNNDSLMVHFSAAPVACYVAALDILAEYAVELANDGKSMSTNQAYSRDDRRRLKVCEYGVSAILCKGLPQ